MKSLAIGLSVVVAVGAIADLLVAVRPARTPVSAQVMAKAAERIRALTEPGDLVVHSPLLTVTELAPLGALSARPDRPKPILQARRRSLVLDFASTPMFGLGTPTAEEAIGEGLVLRTFPPIGDGAGALWALSSDLEPTTMRVERGAQVRTCTADRREGGFSCPGEPDWLYAAVRVLRVGGEDRACVWAHPTTGGAIVLTVPPAPAPAPGHRLELRVQAGLTDDSVRMTPDGATVTTEISQGRALGRVIVPNRVGWVTGEYPIEPGVAAQLKITTPRDGRRHHCIRAQVFEVEQ